MVFPCTQPVRAHALEFPKISLRFTNLKQAASVLSFPALLLNGLIYGTSSNWPQFGAWPLLGISKPITRSSHAQISLYLLLGGPSQDTDGWHEQGANLWQSIARCIIWGNIITGMTFFYYLCPSHPCSLRLPSEELVKRWDYFSKCKVVIIFNKIV